MGSRHRDARHEAQGAGRGKDRSSSEVFRPKVTAPEAQLALLRGAWSKRDLLTDREREIVWSFLRTAEHRALSPAQIATAQDIGRRVGIGYDDPAFDDPSATSTSPSAQPWGPLPLRPPGRLSRPLMR